MFDFAAIRLYIGSHAQAFLLGLIVGIAALLAVNWAAGVLRRKWAMRSYARYRKDVL